MTPRADSLHERTPVSRTSGRSGGGGYDDRERTEGRWSGLPRMDKQADDAQHGGDDQYASQYNYNHNYNRPALVRSSNTSNTSTH